jgi:pimeloyl-ACP methyl ester carboxylesterase
MASAAGVFRLSAFGFPLSAFRFRLSASIRNRPMGLVELVRVETADGVRLDGAYRQPDGNAAGGPVDAFLLVHGTGSNFYDGGVLETFAEQAARDGAAVLRVNTRGHDVVSNARRRKRSPGEPRFGGAAFEDVSECVHDLAAWTAFLTGRGCSRVALVGHSMGAVKVLLTAAGAPIPGVCRAIAVTPPRFCHAHWVAHPKADAFRDAFAESQRLVQSGRGAELMSIRQPMPLLITAEGFLRKYGPADDSDYVPRLPRLAVPALILVGSQSIADSPAFDSLPAALTSAGAANPRVAWQLVEGANTVYAGCADEPYRRARRWIESTRAADGE